MSSWFSSSSSSTWGSSSNHGFMASLSNLMEFIFDTFASVLHSTLALVEFVFLIVSDVFNITFKLVSGILTTSFGIIGGVLGTTFNFVSGIIKNAFGLFQGVLGFIAGNFIAITLCIGTYYLYTSYRRQQSRTGSNRESASTIAQKTFADAASRAQHDASQISGKATETAKAAWETGASYSEKAKAQANANANDLHASAARQKRKVQN